MRKSLRRAVVAWALALFLLGSKAAFGWASPGHMAVAFVAWQQLTPAQQKQVYALLKKNPYYHRWYTAFKAAGVPIADRPRDIFMLAATWPDEIKQDHAYTGTDNPPSGVTGTETTGSYGDMRAHKYWHFVDTPTSPDNTGPSGAPTPNAELQIVYFADGLGTARTAKLRSYDLVWLEHLVGDIHQPLHATTRFLGGKSDIGGNDIALSASPATELHAYWDNLPGKTDNAAPAAMVATAIKFVQTIPALTTDQQTAVADINVHDWTTESYNMALADAYAAPIQQGLGPYTLNAAYKTQALADAQLRIVFAGTRLATLIKADLH